MLYPRSGRDQSAVAFAIITELVLPAFG